MEVLCHSSVKKIEEYILESDETIQSLAEMGNFNRTTLQRVKSGERLAHPGFFQKIDPGSAAFTSRRSGTGNAAGHRPGWGRNLCQPAKDFKLIETISELTEFQIPFSKELHQKIAGRNAADLDQVMQIVSDEKQVLSLIEHSIDRELFQVAEPTVKLAIPYGFQAVYDYLFQQMMGNNKQLSRQDVLSLRRGFDDTVAGVHPSFYTGE